LLCVQWKTPDDGQRNCPKHVEFYSKNKFEKLVHLVGFIIRIYHDARSTERQICTLQFVKSLCCSVACTALALAAVLLKTRPPPLSPPIPLVCLRNFMYVSGISCTYVAVRKDLSQLFQCPSIRPSYFRSAAVCWCSVLFEIHNNFPYPINHLQLSIEYYSSLHKYRPWIRW